MLSFSISFDFHVDNAFAIPRHRHIPSSYLSVCAMLLTQERLFRMSRKLTHRSDTSSDVEASGASRAAIVESTVVVDEKMDGGGDGECNTVDVYVDNIGSSFISVAWSGVIRDVKLGVQLKCHADPARPNYGKGESIVVNNIAGT